MRRCAASRAPRPEAPICGEVAPECNERRRRQRVAVEQGDRRSGSRRWACRPTRPPLAAAVPCRERSQTCDRMIEAGDPVGDARPLPASASFAPSRPRRPRQAERRDAPTRSTGRLPPWRDRVPFRLAPPDSPLQPRGTMRHGNAVPAAPAHGLRHHFRLASRCNAVIRCRKCPEETAASSNPIGKAELSTSSGVG